MVVLFADRLLLRFVVWCDLWLCSVDSSCLVFGVIVCCCCLSLFVVVAVVGGGGVV